MSGPARLAVDLGTTHTVAVVERAGQPARALLFDGSPILPSGVFLAADGVVHTGRDAARLGASEPERFEPHPKRRVDEGSVLLGTAETGVADLLRAILVRVAEEARTAGVDPAGAVLTCPADWGRPRRAVLADAARRAGLGDVRLLDEPVAAATYCTQVVGQQVPAGGAVAVFDFGGGTLDVTVVRREPGGWRVAATGGLDDLGGLDVDDALVGHLGHVVAARHPEVWRRLSAPSTAAERRDRQAFWGEVRAAKEMLSRLTSAPVRVPGQEEPLHLTRDEVERVAGPLVARAVDETRRVLERSGIASAQLDTILLVGGSSRIPLVASRLHARFGVVPSVPEQPELPVAYGALANERLGPIASAQVSAVPTSPSGYPATGATPLPGAPGPGEPGFSTPVSGMPGSGAPVSGLPVSPPGRYPGEAPGPYPGQAPGQYPGQMPGPYPGRAPGQAAGWGAAPPGWQSPSTAGTSAAAGGTPMGAPSAGAGGKTDTGDGAVDRPDSKKIRRRVIVMLTVGAVVAAIATCGTVVTRTVQGWVADVRAGELPGGSGLDDVLSGDGAAPADGELVRAGQPVELGGGATTVAVAGTTVYYARVIGATTEVVAMNAADGKQLWKKTPAIAGREVHLTVLDELLLLDADSATTHDQDDARAVLQRSDGATLRDFPIADTHDVAFLGSDAVMERTSAFDGYQLYRMNLRTGKTVWSTAGVEDTLVIDAHRAEPLREWVGEQGPKQGAGMLPPTEYRHFDSLSASSVSMVQLTDDRRIRVLDMAAGTAKSTSGAGAVPIEDDFWTAFDGQVIGLIDAETSAQPTVAGYGLNDFAKKWELRLEAGESVDRVKPCGEHVVCVAVDSANDQYRTVAVDTTNGRQVWSKPVEFSVDEGWFATPKGVLWGNQFFDTMQDVKLLGPDGKEVANLGDADVYAVRDGRALSVSIKVSLTSQTSWVVRVWDISTGKATGTAEFSTELPKEAAFAGDVGAMIDGKGVLSVYQVKSLG
ncbi:outer membrane protein assembly factor BamB [Catenuloplanes nepalensis]|uniref:Outer membrane protein assembly factor BamB n=1 Tax=Catenuloplanes nepalensis TaxID=587533 RepID=A0ABT9N504_9ACTN|nr:Hsp70 family protein [Catenuloplanes nepalensis]MDP9798790.1 outer membrane protein assembly factor BamB [Catenuloplanes nepalensis]